MPNQTNTLSLKARLGLVALLALILGLVPSGLLLHAALSDLAVVSAEQRGLPLNRDWQALLRQLQLHRQTSAEALGTRPEARTELAARRSAMKAASDQLRTSIRDDGHLDGRHAQALEQFERNFAALSADIDKGGIDAPRLLARHQALAQQAFVAIAEINEDTGLLLDPVPSSYFAIVAGLQAAPHVEDALSELASIARAAAVDDAAGVSAALTRYREHGDTMLQQMQAAQRGGGVLAEELAATVSKATEQRQAVDKAMQAVALDVNYPLDQLAQSFDKAARLQTELSTRVLDMLSAEMERRTDRAALHRNLLLVLIPAVLGLLGWLLWRSMQQLLGPVEQMLKVTARIAAGDLSEPVPSGGSDELGQVLQALADMQQRLRQLIEQIHAGAGSIRVAAQEIAHGNQDLAARTEQAAAQLQQTASNVTVLDDVVHASGTAVTAVTHLAREASQVAGSGGTVVEQVVQTMGSIQQASRRITEITGLIDGLAFQTNILALNAAVEAARAGEQGRGFAVVAAEVRSLAQRSAQAAKEIKQLIQQSVERVESGTQLAGEAGSSMAQIVSTVQSVSELIDGLTQQSRKQAEQTTELGCAVRSIDTMTQQNAALVEQAAASAQSLREQAAAMDKTVQTFRL